MKHILVATDFSKAAEHAVRFAEALAKQTNAALMFLNSYTMPPSGAGSAGMVDISETVAESAKTEMINFEKKRKNHADLGGKEVSYYTKYGHLSDVINEMKSQMAIDLVVMGTQGASGISKKFWGSNASVAAKRVKVPLLIIPPSTPLMRFSKALFSTDMKTLSEAPFLFAAEFSRAADFSIVFLHVYEKQMDSDREEFEAFEKKVGSLFTIQPKFEKISNSDVNDGIEQSISQDNFDLLIMIRHDYGFFEGLFHNSVSQNLVNKAALPILILKE